MFGTLTNYKCDVVKVMVKVELCFSGVHLGAVLENIALVQGIRCEPLGEHFIPWTCAVFFHTARK